MSRASVTQEARNAALAVKNAGGNLRQQIRAAMLTAHDHEGLPDEGQQFNAAIDAVAALYLPTDPQYVALDTERQNLRTLAALLTAVDEPPEWAYLVVDDAFKPLRLVDMWRRERR